ncbi:uncharacterized protein LOC102802673 [Saccoglossus kowalevskii]|uniref:Choline monooxygenase, chloroplastic n=1 Tax=Saccoglossus kowalevskii TaxID=10224 RepID=A0A0U2UDD0_SACKO|nr:PREDICTED: choline monooxygenase, chloroplastic-like [Saccoglossus kowalevskii]ALR88592.1 choline monooxygenase-like 292 [Saccoglossus kowalevskii]
MITEKLYNATTVNFLKASATVALRRYASWDVNPRLDVHTFQCDLPVEEATTPPASWYTHAYFHDMELKTVFSNNWLAVGRVDQLKEPGCYFTGSVGNRNFVVTRDNRDFLHAFHNVCRHRGMTLCSEDSGQTCEFKCPYHGWTYDLTGRLTRAKKLRGIKNFSASKYGLKPLQVSTWGPLVFVNANDTANESEFHDEVAAIENCMKGFEFNESWCFVKRVTYPLKCNWKVVCDNVLDNGYHVTMTHPNYSKLLELNSLKTKLLSRSSICTVESSNNDPRVSGNVMLAHIYPNLILNRYGPWLDTNIVMPVSANECVIIYDYYLLQSFVDTTSPRYLPKYIDDSILDSDKLQREDNMVCEGTQKGLQSSGYEVGRYAPQDEKPDYAFHRHLAEDFKQYLSLHRN